MRAYKKTSTFGRFFYFIASNHSKTT